MPTTKTKIRGVPMQSWQVRALLAGTMSQFRIPLRKQPTDEQWIDGDDRLGFTLEWNGESHGGQVVYNRSEKIAPPYQPGEVLFVKETFISGEGVGGWAPHVDPDAEPDGETIDVIYRADDGQNERSAGPWSPPQHCREIHARPERIKITSVGIGRRQKVKIDDFDALGVGEMLEDPDSIMGRAFDCAEHAGIGGVPLQWEPEIYGYAALWDAQHRKRGNGWAENGYDWKFGFELTDSHGDN